MDEYDQILSEIELLNLIPEAEFLFCLLSDKINDKIINSATNLKAILNYAVGYNNIDIDCATKRNIFVCNTPDVLTETTADLVWALMLAVSRRVVEAHNFAVEGKFDGWSPTLYLGNDVFGKTLGIIGAGRIGSFSGVAW